MAETPKRITKINAFESGVAGAFSGFMTRVVLQPLDFLKIRFQLQIEPTFGKGGGHYHGILQAAKCVYKEEGLFGLWKGHVSAQILTISYGAGQFWSYSFLRQQALNHGYGEHGMTQPICGGLAGLVGTLLSMPFDVTRTRLIAQSIPVYSGIVDLWKKMLVMEGPGSLWKGLMPTLAMTVPFTAIQFHLYYYLSKIYPSEKFLEGNGLFGNLLSSAKYTVCGAAAGVSAKVVVYPLDVLKKRMQMRGSEQIRAKFGKVVIYRNALDCIIKVTKEEGVLGWFKGLLPSLIKSAGFSGLVFTFYEMSCESILYFHSLKDER